MLDPPNLSEDAIREALGAVYGVDASGSNPGDMDFIFFVRDRGA